MTDLERALAKDADEVQLAGNAPLALDSSGAVWFVEEGRVEVFAVPLGAHQARTHLCTVEPGQALCGIEPGRDGHGLTFLAAGHAGTRLRRLSVARLRQLAADPALAAELARRLDGWLIRLFSEVSHAVAPQASSRS